MTSIERHGTAIAMTAFGLLALFGIFARPLLPVDETRYLAVALDMRQHGDWLVPHLNGGIYADKPPLLFWLINLAWTAFGVSETAARLVGPAFGIGAIAATAGLARRLWPADTGAPGRAALALAGFAVFSAYAGLTMFDAVLTLAVVLGMLALVEAQHRPRAWIGLGAALAFGALAKGPVILLHLLPAALATPLWAGEPWRAALLRTLKAVALGLALVGLWLGPAIHAGGPEYRHAVLWTQSAGRVASSFAHGKPWWFFLALLPLILWPWGWSAGLWRRAARVGPGDRGVRLCLVWALGTLALFSLVSGKQAHYLLPALPAVALISARALPGPPVAAPAAALLPLALAGALLALALGFGPADVAAEAHPAWAIALAAALLCGIAAAALALRGPALAALGPALVLTLDLLFLLGAPGRLYDAGPIARLIAPHDGAVAVLWNRYQAEFSFAARLRQPVTELATPDEARDWLAATPNGIVVARLDRPHPDGDPAARIDFDAHSFGLWTATPPPPVPVTRRSPARRRWRS
jgi:4-amino-4-deoxy-L-arabinose transferase-like glycosyltransferase